MRGVAIRNAVPLVLVGEAPAIQLGATISQMLDTLEIECLPKDMPATIEIDVSVLDTAGTRVTVGDLVIPEGVQVLVESDVDVAQASMMTMAAAEPEEEAVEDVEGIEGEEGEAVEGGDSAAEDTE